MRSLGVLEILFIVAGILAVAAGERYALPFLVTPGVFLIGLGIAAAGLEAIFSREVGFSVAEEHGSYRETFGGLAAILWGVFFLVWGVGILVFAAARLFGLGELVAAFLKERPGAVILGGALGGLGLGSALALGSTEERHSFWALLGSLPRRLFGIALILLALLGMALGLLEVLAPAAFDGLVESAGASLPRAPE